MELSFTKPNPDIDPLIEEIIAQAGNIHHPVLVREMILSALKTGQDCDYPADLKMISSTIKEMRYTFKVFSLYRQRKKVTIFGSARIDPSEPIYQKCVRFSRRLAEMGYMIITGGGPGIMQAGNEGAGSDNSFAVNIRLPFEQKPNPVMLANPRLINYKYFFNRKVAFVKESDAIAVFPGGFGTLDEAMEVFTLVQTGKTSPKPLILIDDESGFWDRWFDFVKDGMLARGLISAEDFSIFAITRNEEEAIQVLEDFYRNYHSLRFVDQRLIIRLNKELTAAEIEVLENEFPDIRIPGTHIERVMPLPVEADEPDLLHLPRLALHFDHKHYGLLMAFIGRINTF
jgi:uncharacterized protein (TIGR00730 family)